MINCFCCFALRTTGTIAFLEKNTTRIYTRVMQIIIAANEQIGNVERPEGDFPGEMRRP